MISHRRIQRTIARRAKRYVISRSGEGAFDSNGRWDGLPPEELKIIASIQTATDKDLVDNPEGRRVKGDVTVFTSTLLLRTAKEGTGIQPDTFQWGGEKYQVMKVDDWFVIAGFCKATALKVDR